MKRRFHSALCALLLLIAAPLACADYGWHPFIGVNPPETPGKHPSAELACQEAVALNWYKGEKKYIRYAMNARGDYATCHVELKACSTCPWHTPTPPYWIDGQTIAAIRKGTSCDPGKSYNPKTGECFSDQNNNQGEPPSTCDIPSDKQGNPIAITSGNKYQKESYFQGSDPFPIQLELIYNSLDKRWRHSYSTKLQETSSALVVVFADGRSASFDKATGLPLSGSEPSRLLQENGTWRLEQINGEMLTFNTSGRLLRRSNRQGDLIELTYEDAKQIRFSYNGKLYNYLSQFIKIKSKTQEMRIEERDQSKLVSATTTNKQIGFTWDESLNRLNKASIKDLPSNLVTSRSYHYESPYGSLLLTGVTDERGVRYATWAYNAQYKAIESEHFNGADKVLVSYNADGSSTVTNSLGKKTTYRFAEFGGVKRITAIEGQPSASCPNSNSSFTYDSRGLLKTKTDSKGFLTTYDYNDRGLEVSRTEASGTPQARTITTEWHPSLFLPLVVTESDRIIRYQYDDQGRQLSRTVETR